VSRPLHTRRQLELGAASRTARTIKGVAEILSRDATKDSTSNGAKTCSSRPKEESSFGSEECSGTCTSKTDCSFSPVFSEVDKAHTAGRAVNVNFIRHG